MASGRVVYIDGAGIRHDALVLKINADSSKDILYVPDEKIDTANSGNWQHAPEKRFSVQHAQVVADALVAQRKETAKLSGTTQAGIDAAAEIRDVYLNTELETVSVPTGSFLPPAPEPVADAAAAGTSAAPAAATSTPASSGGSQGSSEQAGASGDAGQTGGAGN